MTITDIKLCHDCEAKEGQLHDYGCDMERCPYCEQQLISCECCYEKMDIDISEGTWAYKHGLTNAQSDKWLVILNNKGRIPYVRVPVLCALCGGGFPPLFNVPDEEWERYVIPELQRQVLCLDCYNNMKTLFPYGWRNAGENGGNNG